MIRPTGLTVALLVVAHAVVAARAADEAGLTHLVPSGGQQGKSVEVVLLGTLNGGDQRRAWASHPGLSVEFGKKADRVQVVIKPDVPPGRHFLRMANAGAASPLLPFVVSPIAEVSEKEPNGRIADAQKFDATPRVVNGVLSESRDVDTFGVPLKAGQTLVVAMMAHTELGSPMDGLLQIVTEKGFVVAQDDDSLGLDAFVTFTPKRDGQYFIRTFAFPVKTNSTIGLASGKDFVYRLTITSGPYVDFTVPAAFSVKAPSQLLVAGWNLTDAQAKWTIDPKTTGVGGRYTQPHWANTVSLKPVKHSVVVEVEPNGRKQPQAVSVPATVSGRIEKDKDRDVFEFNAVKGKPLRVSVESRRLGYPLDPVLRISDSKGKTLTETDTRSADKIDETVNWTPPADGKFQVEVRDLFEHGGERFVYRLTIEPAPVRVAATVEKGVWELGPKTLDLKVAVVRSGGFDKPVRFELADVPPGVEAAAVISEPKGASAKAVTLKIQRKPDGKAVGGTLRIVGRVEGEKVPVAVATAPIPRLTDRSEFLWLVVKPAAKKAAGKKKKK